MAYDELLEDRISQFLNERKVKFEKKKMMGGLCFMVNNKMCCGIVKDELMARIGPDNYQEALEMIGCREMNFTDKPMKGYVFVEPNAIDLDEDLDHWLQWCLDFNPQAISSKQ